jgi:tetratricopeptide (TPR) repeat protein
MKTLSGITSLIILVVATNLQAADSYCGELDPEGQFGPYDYANSSDRKNLPIVEQFHFTPGVENLISGNTTYIGGDLDYVLRAFPNHYRALESMAKLSLREKTLRPEGAKWVMECYFDRAIRFRPADGMVRLIYGNYLQRLGGRQDDVLEQYQVAVSLQPENANINYNLGLMYLKKKDYEQSIVYAKKAYELGFPFASYKGSNVINKPWFGNIK